MKFPPAPTVPAPKREALIELFDRVNFHPLSIRVLAQQLKTRRMAELGERLEQLLRGAAVPAAGSGGVSPPGTPGVTPGEPAGGDACATLAEDTPAGLLASLELSLDKLDEAARQVLPRLGVFQGGAFEDDLIAITGLGDTGEREKLEGFLAAVEAGKAKEIFQAMGQPVPNDPQLRELVASLRAELAKLPPAPAANLWPGLRRQLEAAALIEAEDVPGVTVPFLRFHPTVAPMLWARLDAAERVRLTTAHRQRYYALSRYLYQEDTRDPHQAHAIAWRELPNLLHAVHAALDAGDPEAGTFASAVDLFIGYFGLRQEAERLSARAQQAAPDAGSWAWVLAQSNRGEQLLAARQVAEATQVFQAILQQLGDSPAYERALTLHRLGRCFEAGGQPMRAERQHRKGLAVIEKLKVSDSVKRERSALLTDLADVLAAQGKFADARQAYQDGLTVKAELNDLRGQGVTLGQLGTLAMREGNLVEAADRYRAALALFQQLREPDAQAQSWHGLGMVFQEAQQWDEAERHYREAATLHESGGRLQWAAQIWCQLANVSVLAGKPVAAELWYRKAIEGFQAGTEAINLSKGLSNLAGLLQTQPGRLAEARQLAEEALAIKQTLDPGAAEIWKSYELLAQIAEQEALGVPPSGGGAEEPPKGGTPNKAREYRRLAREAKRNFAGTRHELKRHAGLILATVATCAGQAEAREFVAKHQADVRQAGPEGESLARTLDRILAGERDEAALCEGVGFDAAMIIETILASLRDPQALADLLPASDAEPS